MNIGIQIVFSVLSFFIKKYIASSNTSHDEKLLNIVKNGAKYLAEEKSTDVTLFISEVLNKCNKKEIK